eukprot:CAMPEP_0171244232 /NCGR_PEP_ID=MMETSP0790-20130122/46728_1 /TAXON_ID=2925 /ORGANISM="Alexandrium catenella, Strain OF101" /LENGTH=31 /DNA_ID= /DNA_START= /DNA_END= /DNA_ORIENTATION=
MQEGGNELWVPYTAASRYTRDKELDEFYEVQ